MEPVYRSVVGLFLTAFKLRKWDLRVTGGEHVPQVGGAVIATNHIGYIDFVFVGAAVRSATTDKRLVRFAAKSEVFRHRLVGPLMRAMRHIPVEREGNAGAAIDHGVRLLQAGELVGMFPEATINRSFVPIPAKTGTVRMAQGAGVPIIPGAVWGSHRLLTKGRPRDLRRDVVVTIDLAPPIHPAPDDDPETVSKELMDIIGAMVDHAQRTYPQEPASESERWWLPAHLGGTAPTPAEAEAEAMAERRARTKKRQEGDGA